MVNKFIQKIVALVTANVENIVTQKMVTPDMTNSFNSDLNVIKTKISNMQQEAKQVEASLIDLAKKYPFISVEDQLKTIYEGYEIVKLVADKNAWIGNSVKN